MDMTRNREKKAVMIDCQRMCVYGIFTYIFWLLRNVSGILIFNSDRMDSATQVTESEMMHKIDTKHCIDDINSSL